jgi:hypothetical protein
MNEPKMTGDTVQAGERKARVLSWHYRNGVRWCTVRFDDNSEAQYPDADLVMIHKLIIERGKIT